VTLNPDALPSPNVRATEPILGARLVTTASVPADRRLAFWREVVCQTIAGVEARPLASRRSYDGRILSRPVQLQDFRHFDLLHVVADPQRVNRTRELIDIQAEEAWLLMLQEHGTCSILQGDQRSTLAPGDIGFLDTSRPYEVLFPKAFRQSILKVPASLFMDIIPLRRDVAGLALAGSDPLTAIARTNLLMLERFAHTISPTLLPAAAERAIDHLSLAMRARLDDSPIRRDRGTSARHFARASLYIIDHLRDSDLSVERIANATGISPGHLYEVFRRATGGRSAIISALSALNAVGVISPIRACGIKASLSSLTAGAFRKRAASAARFAPPTRRARGAFGRRNRPTASMIIRAAAPASRRSKTSRLPSALDPKALPQCGRARADRKQKMLPCDLAIFRQEIPAARSHLLCACRHSNCRMPIANNATKDVGEGVRPVTERAFTPCTSIQPPSFWMVCLPVAKATFLVSI
jgi:hypothetical protein